MQNTIKATGSKSLSEIAVECGVTGGEFRLEIIGDASPVAASIKAGTARIAADDFFFALASLGATRKAIIRRALGFALARAKGEKVIIPKKAKKLAKRISAIYRAKLPPVESKAGLRIEAEARAI